MGHFSQSFALTLTLEYTENKRQKRPGIANFRMKSDLFSTAGDFDLFLGVEAPLPGLAFDILRVAELVSRACPLLPRRGDEGADALADRGLK